MSPSFRTWLLGIPWMTSSFTEMQAAPGKSRTPGGPGKCRNDGDGPLPFDEFANCSIYLKSGYAGTYHFARQRTGRRSNLSRTAHPLNISGRL